MTIKTGGLVLGLAVAACMGLAPVAQAQQAAAATELGTFNAWTAWKASDASGIARKRRERTLNISLAYRVAAFAATAIVITSRA